MKKYYLTRRPAAPGAVPREIISAENYPEPREIDGIGRAYGFILTEDPLDGESIAAYELTPEDAAEGPEEAALIAAVMENFRSPREIQAGAKRNGYSGARELLEALCGDMDVDPRRAGAIMKKLAQAYRAA